jgi:hypothetical protein
MGIPLYYKLKELQLEKVIHRKICISKEYILIHFDSTITTTTYCNIKMSNFFIIQLLDSKLRRWSFEPFESSELSELSELSEPSKSSNRHHDNWAKRKFYSFVIFLLLCGAVFSEILPFLLSSLLPLTRCDQVLHRAIYIPLLCATHILIMPIIFHCSCLLNNRHQNIVWRISIISYFMIIFTFITIVFIIVYNNNVVIIQQGDKVYQCVRTYGLTLQAYPVVSDLNSSVIEDYRSHGYSCDLSSYGPIVPYEQTLKAPPNYLEAFVCEQNDPEGVNLCHLYGSVSFDWEFLPSLICNCTLGNGKDAGVTAAIWCLWKRYIWVTVPKSDVITHHEGNFTRHQ